MTDRGLAEYLRENGYPEHICRAGAPGLLVRWTEFVDEVVGPRRADAGMADRGEQPVGSRRHRACAKDSPDEGCQGERPDHLHPGEQERVVARRLGRERIDPERPIELHRRAPTDQLRDERKQCESRNRS